MDDWSFGVDIGYVGLTMLCVLNDAMSFQFSTNLSVHMFYSINLSIYTSPYAKPKLTNGRRYYRASKASADINKLSLTVKQKMSKWTPISSCHISVGVDINGCCAFFSIRIIAARMDAEIIATTERTRTHIIGKKSH